MVAGAVEIENVIVIGSGLMGIGIAQVTAEAGVHVTLVGRSDDKCAQARSKIAAGVLRSARRRLPNDADAQQAHVDATLDCLTLCTSLAGANLLNADLIVESIVEDLKEKQELFGRLEAEVNSECLLVTNTSSFLLSDVSTKMNSRTNFASLHFFNPVAAMKLVEVVRDSETSNKTVEALLKFCRQIGKTPVQCKDAHGFIVNRLLIPYIADGLRMAERGDAEPRDIDEAMRLGTGNPLGPVALADVIGLDTLASVLNGWHQRFPSDARYTPIASLEKLVADGRLGRKTGHGYYVYPPR